MASSSLICLRHVLSSVFLVWLKVFGQEVVFLFSGVLAASRIGMKSVPCHVLETRNTVHS